METSTPIYLDTSVFSRALLDTDERSERARMMLRRIRKGDTAAYTSALTFDEITYIVWKAHGITNAERAARSFLQQSRVRIIAVDAEILSIALQFIQQYQLYPRDAIHAACAFQHHLTTIISTDADFDKVKELKRKEP